MLHCVKPTMAAVFCVALGLGCIVFLRCNMNSFSVVIICELHKKKKKRKEKIDIRNQINLLATSISFLVDAFLKDPQEIK